MLVNLLRYQPKVLSWHGSRFIFPLGLVVITAIFLSNYLAGVTTVLLAGYVAIASTTRNEQPVKRHRFAIAAFMLALLTWFVPVNTVLYFTVGLAFFYWIEVYYASVHFLGIIALFLSSPAFQYASGVFSFPIRLQLTKIVGGVFSLFASNVEFKGNTIFYRGQEFAVDPACMGLHMLSISLLLGIFLLGLLQKKAGRTVDWKWAVFYVSCLFALNLIANVLRIILLVQFAIPPEATMHDIVGLLCLLIYVCLPACFLAKFFVSKAVAGSESNKTASQKSSVKMQWVLMAALLFVAQRVATVDTYAQFKNKYAQPVNGYTTSVYAPGILKLQNEESLVYVKFIRGFYDTEHNPSMCWKGSGYTFKEIKKQSFGGHEVYTALLYKNNDKLYTAWWYGNRHQSTTSQWEWRLNMLKGSEGYAVINVTATSQAALRLEAEKVLLTQTLLPFFQKSTDIKNTTNEKNLVSETGLGLPAHSFIRHQHHFTNYSFPFSYLWCICM